MAKCDLDCSGFLVILGFCFCDMSYVACIASVCTSMSCLVAVVLWDKAAHVIVLMTRPALPVLCMLHFFGAVLPVVVLGPLSFFAICRIICSPIIGFLMALYVCSAIFIVSPIPVGWPLFPLGPFAGSAPFVL